MRNRFSLILFFYYSQFCILFSFAAVFFREQGYSEGQIGQLAAFSGLAVLAANPAAGRLADRFGEKRVTVVCLAISVVMAAGLYLFRKSFAGVILFYGLVSVFSKAVTPLLDNWLFRYSGEHHRVSYGSTRAIGSLGSALCAAGAGILIDRAGFKAVFLIGMVFTLIAAGIASMTSQGRKQSNESKKSDINVKVLLSNRKYVILILTAGLLFLGVTTEVTFYPVLFMDCGGNNRMLGFSLFLMSCSEMTGLSLYFRFRRRIAARHLLLVSMLFYTIKIAFQIFLTGAGSLICLQLLQGLTYGLFLPSVVEMVSDLVPPKMSATGMGLCAACFNGAGVVLGNWLAAFVCEKAGLRSAYLSASIFCLAAVVIYYVGMLREKRKPDAGNNLVV